jgi:ketosteroid isomerase-like protein
MSGTDAKTIASQFNHCINAGDIEGLSALMTDDHRFVDSAGNAVSGKQACVKAWTGFFAAFPDYRNVFERFQETENAVAISGRSSCSDPRLAGPALWMAKLRDGSVSEWRVLEDTPENRAELGL